MAAAKQVAAAKQPTDSTMHQQQHNEESNTTTKFNFDNDDEAGDPVGMLRVMKYICVTSMRC